jgi:hypothetical protein
VKTSVEERWHLLGRSRPAYVEFSFTSEFTELTTDPDETMKAGAGVLWTHRDPIALTQRFGGWEQPSGAARL